MKHDRGRTQDEEGRVAAALVAVDRDVQAWIFMRADTRLDP
jgi:hypothetical protein